MSQIENARRRDPKNNTAAASSEVPFHLQLPSLDDAASIQRAVSLVVHALATGALEAGRARTILYGLQIAASNARRLPAKDESNQQPAETQQTATACEVSEAAPEIENDVLSLRTTEESDAEGSDIEESDIEESDIEESNAEGSNVDAPAAAVQSKEPINETSTEAQDIYTPSPSTHIAEPREIYIAPSCSSRTNSYNGNARDRLLAFRQKGSNARGVTHDISQ